MLYDYFQHISFANGWLLWAECLLPIWVWFYFKYAPNQHAAWKVSNLTPPLLAQTWKTTLRHVPFYCRLLAVALLIIVLARPQIKTEQQHADGEGIDIVLCLDVSGSMVAQDLLPNRLEAAKKVAKDFVSKRMTDRMAVVIFSAESFTQCPITNDQNMLLAAIANIKNGLLENGTSIGDGLATSVDRLRNSKAKSKVIVLLTDGENNGGLIAPATAKEIARTFNIKVYTIGVGTDGYAPFPVETTTGIVYKEEKVSIDENLLREISDATGGKYYRAKDNEGLASIYKEIDQLEKSKVEITTLTRISEKYLYFLAGAMFLLSLEFFLRYVILKKYP
jgi:Ca-activated chloride channel family protein